MLSIGKMLQDRLAIRRIKRAIRRRQTRGHYEDVRLATEDLCKTVDERSLRLLIRTLQSDKDYEVRLAAASALGGIGGEKALRALENAACSDRQYNVRHAALFNLAQIGGEQALRAIEGALQSCEFQDTRPVAAMALARIGGNDVAEVLGRALEGGGSGVQNAVVEALAQVGGDRSKQLLKKSANKFEQETIITLVRSLSSGHDAPMDALVEVGQPVIEPILAAFRHHIENAPLVGAPEFNYDGLCQVLIRIGEASVGPLAQYFRDSGQIIPWNSKLYLGKGNFGKGTPDLTVVGALRCLGWEPTRDIAGAYFYAATEQFDKCAQLGEVAMEPLLGAIEKLVKWQTSKWYEEGPNVLKLMAEGGGAQLLQSLVRNSRVHDSRGELQGAIARMLLKTKDLRGAQAILELLFQEVSDPLWNTGIACGGALTRVCARRTEGPQGKRI